MKIKFFLISFLLFLPIISAELIITPNSVNENILIGEQKQITLSIKNNFSFPVYNLILEPTVDITLSTIDILNPQEQKTATLTLKPTAEYQKSINPKIQFQFYSIIVRNPITHNVRITDSSFIPSTLQVYQDDSVQWTNEGTVTHTATETTIPPEFDISIPVNQSGSFTFTKIKTYIYHDEAIFFNGLIQVLNKSEEKLTVNPDLYKPLPITLSTSFQSTQISLEPLESEFTVNYNETELGAIRIKNTGTATAHNLKLEGEWFIFRENDFSLNQGDSNLVLYDIKPIITKTEETNLTYLKSIKLIGSNINPINTTISIKIPYSSITAQSQSNVSRDELAKQVEALKKILEQFNFTLSPEGEIIVRESDVNITLTSTELKDFLLNFRGFKDILERSVILQNQDRTEIKQGDLATNSTLSSLIAKIDTFNEKSKNQSIVFWTTASTVAIVVSIFSIFKYLEIMKKTKLKKMMYFNQKDKLL